MYDFDFSRAYNRPRGHWRVKLTDAQVQEVKERYASGGVTQQQLAKDYGVSQYTISRVVNGKSREK